MTAFLITFWEMYGTPLLLMGTPAVGKLYTFQSCGATGTYPNTPPSKRMAAQEPWNQNDFKMKSASSSVSPSASKFRIHMSMYLFR